MFAYLELISNPEYYAIWIKENMFYGYSGQKPEHYPCYAQIEYIGEGYSDVTFAYEKDLEKLLKDLKGNECP